MSTPGTDWWSVLSRLALALLPGAVIGWERHATGKPAGLRTHMLVSLGAAIFVLTALDDPTSASRAVQGVAAGVGFLGAGEILHITRTSAGHERVKGLTSAAAVWVAAALGIAAGYGLFRIVLAGSGITLFILTVMKWVEDRLVTIKKEP